jgi:hypothetical protein
MTTLTIIQASFDEIGFPRPSSVVGSTDQLARQGFALLNRTGKELSREHDWKVMVREHSFSTADGTSDYALPSDFDHFINDSGWNRSDHEPLIGPLSAQHWQVIKSGTLGSGAYGQRWRVKRSTSGVIANRFVLDPTPTEVETLIFEYVSDSWCADSAGTTGQAALALDTDVPLLPEHLLIQGLIWRLLKAKGLEYGDSLAEYQTSVQRAIGRDGGAPKLSLGGRQYGVSLISSRNIPDTGFGL